MTLSRGESLCTLTDLHKNAHIFDLRPLKSPKGYNSPITGVESKLGTVMLELGVYLTQVLCHDMRDSGGLTLDSRVRGQKFAFKGKDFRHFRQIRRKTHEDSI